MDASTGSVLSQKIVRNTVFNFLGRVWTMFVGLLLMPYLISKLGVEQFGVWPLVFPLTRYLDLLDLGASTATVKYIAEYYTRRDYGAINGIVNTGFAFYIAFGFILTTAVIASNDVILSFLKIPPDLFNEARFVLVGGAIILSLSNAFGVFQAVTVGLQRMDISNAITLIASVPDLVGTIIFLELGYGLKGLIFKEALVFVVSASLSLFYAFRLLPPLRLSLRFCQRKSLQVLLGYGIKVQVSKLADFASSQVNKILLGHFLGLGSVTFYELGSKVVLSTKRVSRVVISAVMPAASEIDAKQDSQTLLHLYIRGSRYLTLAAVPAFAFIVIAAPLVMRFWMGSGYELSVLAIQLLALGHFVHLLTGIGTMIVKGIGKPEYETQYTLLLLLMNTFLGVVLTVRLGFIGVLIATSLSLFLTSLYFMIIIHRLLKVPLVHFVKTVYLKPLMACLLASLPVLVLTQFIKPSLLGGRMDSLATLGAGGLLFFCTYLVILFKLNYLDTYDRNLITYIGKAVLKAREITSD